MITAGWSPILLRMPGRGTPKHSFRISDALWDRCGQQAWSVGADREAVLRQLVAWYVGEGELPTRPVDVDREPES